MSSLGIGEVEAPVQIGLPDGVVLLRADGGDGPAPGVSGERGGQKLRLPVGEALVHPRGGEELVEGGGGGHQGHGLVPLVQEMLVRRLKELPGVAPALEVRVRGQGVEVAHGEGLPLRGPEGGGQEGRHGGDGPVRLRHHHLAGGADLIVKEVDIGRRVPEAFFPQLLLAGDLIGGGGSDGQHGPGLLSIWRIRLFPGSWGSGQGIKAATWSDTAAQPSHCSRSCSGSPASTAQ